MKTPTYLNFEVWVLKGWDTKWRFIAKDLVYHINPNWTYSPFFNSSTFNSWVQKPFVSRKSKSWIRRWEVTTYESFLNWLSNK